MAARTRFKKGKNPTLADDLRSWRERNRFSQSAAAMKLNISKRTLEGWEHGRHEPRGLALVALRAKIGYSVPR
jgi:DNA-binding transcriptional regulator YiaG